MTVIIEMIIVEKCEQFGHKSIFKEKLHINVSFLNNCTHFTNKNKKQKTGNVSKSINIIHKKIKIKKRYFLVVSYN